MRCPWIVGTKLAARPVPDKRFAAWQAFVLPLLYEVFARSWSDLEKFARNDAPDRAPRAATGCA